MKPTKKIKKTISITPHFTDGKTNPLNQVEWTKSDVTIPGETVAVFTQKDVEHPKDWGALAVKIAASKYFYGDHDNGTDPYKGGRENSIRVLIERVVSKITDMGLAQGYFTKATSKIFSNELAAILVQQRAAFNSPVWFNVGLDRYGCGKKQKGNWRWDEKAQTAVRCETQYDHPQSSACLPYRGRVNTTKGLIPIGEIVRRFNNGENFEVYDKNGNPSPIIAAVCNGKRRTSRINYYGGIHRDLTSDHTVFIETETGTEERLVKELNPDDNCILSRNALLPTTGEVILQGEALTTDDAWMAGIMIGNGFSGRSPTSTSDTWELKVNTQKQAEHIARIATLNQLSHNIQEFHWGYVIRGYGEAGQAYWSRLNVWDKTNAKEIPEWAFRSPIPIVVQLLQGLFDTDGHISPKPNERCTIHFSNTSQQVTQSISWILLSLGIFNNITEYNDPRIENNRKTIWYINIQDMQSVKLFEEIIGFTHENKGKTLTACREYNKETDYKASTIKVSEVELGRLTEQVYDIQTECGTFWYQGILIHNCFIQSVQDDMDSILELAHAEAMLFKYGSGTGSDLSPLRSTREKLSGGGKPSGPLSFLKIYDQIAGTIKSGGKCLSARQPIWTTNGPKTAKELAESKQDFIGLSFDPPSGQIKLKTGRVWATESKIVVKVTTNKGTFEPSFDHPMRLASGEYCPAGSLQPEMVLHAATTDGTENYQETQEKVVTVKALGLEQVYDVEIDCPTEDDKSSNSGHNFLIFSIGATDSIGTGIFVSNTRRAAKMNILKDWHPDIEEFIDAKTLEEKKAWALIDAGYDGSFNGEAYGSVMYQNENLSVRVSDRFMQAAIDGKEWWTRRVTDGQKCEKKDAQNLLRKIAEGTYVCGDPGMQFDDTIDRYHTCRGTERQNATNPCSEYSFLDNTSCNLSSINLLKFKNTDGSFDIEGFISTTQLLILAQEIIVDGASYPTKKIAANSHQFRTLGLGFANIGALLMSYGVGYDSDEGRDLCSAITSLMTGEAYAQSARIAECVGPFPSYHKADSEFFPLAVAKDNVKPMKEVIALHTQSNKEINPTKLNEEIQIAATKSWKDATNLGNKFGYRNAQVSVLAPTGTIGFLMGCDTTGIEPAIALVAHKTLAGGGYLPIVNGMVPAALTSLGYSKIDIEQIEKYILDNGTIEGAPNLKEKHVSVFDCAISGGSGTRSLSPSGHLKMMAAAQPFLSGAISKTVNLPETASVDNIMETYIQAWKMGIKAVAIYRDGSKRSAPLTTKKSSDTKKEVSNGSTHPTPVRRRLENERTSLTHKFQVGGQEGYITVGLFPDGRPGEMFIRMSKQGSTISGLMDAFATMFSMALQYGVPIETLVNKFSHSSFAPAGFTGNKLLPSASSVIDYIVRYIHLRFGEDAQLMATTDFSQKEAEIIKIEENHENPQKDTGKVCHNCGSSDIVVSGTCGVCTNCGTSQGCS